MLNSHDCGIQNQIVYPDNNGQTDINHKLSPQIEYLNAKMDVKSAMRLMIQINQLGTSKI